MQRGGSGDGYWLTEVGLINWAAKSLGKWQKQLKKKNRRRGVGVWENVVYPRLGCFSQGGQQAPKTLELVEEENNSNVHLCCSRLAEQWCFKEAPQLKKKWFCFPSLSPFLFLPPHVLFHSLRPTVMAFCLQENVGSLCPLISETAFQSFHGSLFEYYLWNGNLSIKHETVGGLISVIFNNWKWNQIWVASKGGSRSAAQSLF